MLVLVLVEMELVQVQREVRRVGWLAQLQRQIWKHLVEEELEQLVHHHRRHRYR